MISELLRLSSRLYIPPMFYAFVKFISLRVSHFWKVRSLHHFYTVQYSRSDLVLLHKSISHQWNLDSWLDFVGQCSQLRFLQSPYVSSPREDKNPLICSPKHMHTHVCLASGKGSPMKVSFGGKKKERRILSICCKLIWKHFRPVRADEDKLKGKKF